MADEGSSLSLCSLVKYYTHSLGEKVLDFECPRFIRSSAMEYPKKRNATFCQVPGTLLHCLLPRKLRRCLDDVQLERLWIYFYLKVCSVILSELPHKMTY